ncbi:hypothetical protein P8452_48419 [Trifolium repens]|nr:hypothetical protein P8452_48419 [Trifolium repens]
MLKNLSCLQTLKVDHFPKLKELPNESFNLALERLEISYCDELESLPEQIWEGYATRSSLFTRSYCHATFTVVFHKVRILIFTSSTLTNWSQTCVDRQTTL